MDKYEIKLTIDAELSLAEKSRVEGFEGRARVCARRAVGIAIREYVRQRQIPVASENTYSLLLLLRNLPNISPDIQRAADLFLIRVNEEFQLPPNIDLLSEARWLVEKLGNEVTSQAIGAKPRISP